MRDPILGSVHASLARARSSLLAYAREDLDRLDERPIIGAITCGPIDVRIVGERVGHERWAERAAYWSDLTCRAPEGSLVLYALYSEAETIVAIIGPHVWWARRAGGGVSTWQSRRADPLDLCPVLTW